MRTSKYFLDFEEKDDPIVEIEILIVDARKGYDEKKYGKDEFIHKLQDVNYDYRKKYISLIKDIRRYNKRWIRLYDDFLENGYKKMNKTIKKLNNKIKCIETDIIKCNLQLNFLLDTVKIIIGEDNDKKLYDYTVGYDNAVKDFYRLKDSISNINKDYDKYVKRYDTLKSQAENYS